MSGSVIHGGGITAAAARFGGRTEDWLDLSTGLNPCPPALPEVALRAWHRLPDRHLERDARRAAQSFYRTGDVLPLPVPGTQSAIQMLPRLVASERSVAILSPTYGEYGRVFEAEGRPVERIAGLDDVDGRHGLVMAVNPNNPTGRIFQSEELLAVAERLSNVGGLLVVDEAFGDCLPEVSVAGKVMDHPNLIVFRSFGKFFGMAGIRLGFVVAAPEILEGMESRLGPWAVSGPALSVAASLLSGETDGIRERIVMRRAALGAVLADAGLRVSGGTDLFALVEEEKAAALHEHLCQAHILTRAFDYAPTWLRIGLAPDEDADRRLAQALKAWRR
ncbi:threonine-phosphate decarboxylase [Rhizobium cremeum]|uniref:threonine-phosphate decarboxylase CobD n=1 Tax=Rhizobium cremeum TaxID=2813827 RepID=UPI000DD6DA5A|nr:threonine-phosphate decarboxylase CobD [Rhizobium cremeum]MCJ7993011.1 threonine-phosphate decarboxylase [Rhizobium cremeum]MCJ7998076.1 threonine-phosphate decarboxylase [Rhizobium cremeum]